MAFIRIGNTLIRESEIRSVALVGKEIEAELFAQHPGDETIISIPYENEDKASDAFEDACDLLECPCFGDEEDDNFDDDVVANIEIRGAQEDVAGLLDEILQRLDNENPEEWPAAIDAPAPAEASTDSPGDEDEDEDIHFLDEDDEDEDLAGPDPGDETTEHPPAPGPVS